MTDPCVVGRLFGGLGNQLFIYAFNVALAERNGVPVHFDTTSGFRYDRRYRRTLLLQHLLPMPPVAGRWRTRDFPMGRQLRKLDRVINRQRPLHARYYVREPSLGFSNDVCAMRVTQPTVFDGYWQAPRYFDDMRPSLRQRLEFSSELIAPLQRDLARIRDAGDSAVCLAVRRYEEVRNPKHVIQGIDYFERAMQQIERHVSSPQYFVFAQDLAWARQHIRSHHPVHFAAPRDAHTGVVQDLYLMTQCRHHILSNSSLHWWSAWLDPKANQKVICPQLGWPNADMLMDTWHRID